MPKKELRRKAKILGAENESRSTLFFLDFEILYKNVNDPLKILFHRVHLNVRRNSDKKMQIIKREYNYVCLM